MTSVKEAVSKLLAIADEGSDAYIWNDLLSEHPDGLDLQGADLTGRSLDGYSFERCDLQGANFGRCSLQGANFENANLKGIVLIGADLRGANLRHTQASGANLEGARLDNADMSWAFFKDANLAGVDLTKVQLWKTDLRNANFPEFKKGKDQDYLVESGAPVERKRVHFTRLLRLLGAMIGVPYRWTGSGDLPQVELPPKDADPQRYLDAVIIELGLRKIPHKTGRGEVEFYEITR
ncbi:MAG: pentapeptide repeat-containing protein [Planctomycetota bacterium]